MQRLLILALTLVVACSDSSTQPLVPSLAGQWTGTVRQVGGGGNVPITANLTQSGLSLSGTGVLGTATVPVVGSMSSNGEVIISYRIDDLVEPTNPPRFVFLVGDVSRTAMRIDGLLHGWDVSTPGVTLTRQ